ncbi:hypothetical protein [Paraburkholderia humisilvae]|uniref:Uncharacterized protein n=1 Tax=Paraburkholderia humisilvae TaxID=627669 RepID=A0A6J5E1E8_9BURK|nr:hypothetical protein [Paraburkholderia humisilvae]CAB3760280.1 hypothetical protein LMG29542_03802 [Paraburkholderia humisilvae]
MPESIIDPSVKHTAEQPVEAFVRQAAMQLAIQPAQRRPPRPARPAARPRTLANQIMWLVILWCAGFGATFLFVLPFHLLVQWAVHR